jgi:hypothetical protein
MKLYPITLALTLALVPEAAGAETLCLNCPGNFKFAYATKDVDHGANANNPDPGCLNPVDKIVDAIKNEVEPWIEEAASKQAAGAVASYAGPAAGIAFDAVVGPEIGKKVATIIQNNSGVTNAAQCTMLCVLLPEGALFQYYTYGSMENQWRINEDAEIWPRPKGGGRFEHCYAKGPKDCAIGWSRFDETPVLSYPRARQPMICSAYKNWSGDRKRQAFLGVWYKLGGSQGPAGQIGANSFRTVDGEIQ